MKPTVMTPDPAAFIEPRCPHRPRLRTGVARAMSACLFLILLGTSDAATFRPSIPVYGVLRDSYGLRIGSDGAIISAFAGTNEVARTRTRPQPAGLNFRFDINVRDPQTARAGDVIPGTPLTFRVRTGVTWQPVIGTSTFAMRGDGSSVRMDLILGVDSDGDGLPDDWERMVIANSGGLVSSLAQVGPGMDLDQDGIPDDQEFLSGTFPFLPGDELRVSDLTVTPEGRLGFSFSSVPGARYAVETTPSLEPRDWRVTPVGLAPDSLPGLSEFVGDGRVVTVYFAPGGMNQFYRLRSR